MTVHPRNATHYAYECAAARSRYTTSTRVLQPAQDTRCLRVCCSPVKIHDVYESAAARSRYTMPKSVLQPVQDTHHVLLLCD